MTDALRITADEVKKRMEAGEQFTFIDVRNPQAWAESDTMLPEAVRFPIDNLEQNLPRIPKNKPVVTYCTTRRRFKRQFGAETSGTWLPERVGTQRRIPSMAERWIARRAKTASSLASAPASRWPTFASCAKVDSTALNPLGFSLLPRTRR
jgi:hypothetical protein